MTEERVQRRLAAILAVRRRARVETWLVPGPEIVESRKRRHENREVDV